MCNRYASYLPAEVLRRIFGTVNPLPNFKPSWNVAPTQSAPVVRRHPETGERHLDLFEWGLLRWWQKDTRQPHRPINARAEALAKRGTFSSAFRRRRCIVPGNTFYEQKGEQPLAVARIDGRPIAFAGLWEECRLPNWTVLRTFAIVTTTANAEMAELHDRMPMILEPADWAVWLGEVEGNPASLLHPSPARTLRVWPDDRRLGSPLNNGPELPDPAAEPVPHAQRRSAKLATPDGDARTAARQGC